MGTAYACGITTSGTTACWGVNDAGQLGTGNGDDQTAPAPVAASGFVAVFAGGKNNVLDHTCALNASGAADCWGADDQGQLGAAAGATCASLQPVPCGPPTPADDAGASTLTVPDARSPRRARTCFSSPEFAFVLDDGQRAVGYVIGTPDTAAFARACRARWIPRLAGRYPVPPDPPTSEGGGVARPAPPPGVAGLARPGGIPGPTCTSTCCRRLQEPGHGRALMETFYAVAARAGAAHVHVAVTTANIDFEVASGPVGAGAIEGERMAAAALAPRLAGML